MATYNDWLRAVDVQLHNRKLGVSTVQFDPLELDAAFQSGTSPVQFAMQVQQGTIKPMRAAPVAVTTATVSLKTFTPPSYRVLKFLTEIFSFVAWATWIVAVGTVIVGGGEYLQAVLDNRRSSVVDAARSAWAYQAIWAFGACVVGCCWMLLAQGICLLVGIHREVTEINAKTPQP